MVLSLVTWSTALYLALDVKHPPAFSLPTRVVLPTATATLTASPPATATPTPTVTGTFTPTMTATSTATATPTLSTRVLAIQAVMPGVYVAPTLTPFPFGITLLPAPPQPIEPLPDATRQPPPYEGWISFESDHPNVIYATPWEARQVVEASQGQYHRTMDGASSVSFAFEGEGLRIRYVAARNMGIFQIVVDGVVIDTIDAYALELSYPGTQVYILTRGAHWLELRGTGQRNTASEGQVIGLDAIQIYRGSATTLILPPPVDTSVPTMQPQPAAGIQLVAAPPTVQPTITALPPAVVNISLVIAYDENGNRAVDPAEGVSGISVRVVEVGTNRVISQAFTDSRGFAQLQVVTSAQARLVVPYFSEVWDIPNSRRGGNVGFTLLLTPGNQPGLIP